MSTGVNEVLAPLLNGSRSSAQAVLNSCLTGIHKALIRFALSLERLNQPPNESYDQLAAFRDALSEVNALVNADVFVLAPWFFRNQLRYRLKWIEARAARASSLAGHYHNNPPPNEQLRRQADQLLNSGQRLRSLQHRMISYGDWWSFRSLIAALVLLTLLATLYLNSLSGMTPESRQVIFPAGPHVESTEADVVLSVPLNSWAYFDEFSKYYFRRPSDYEADDNLYDFEEHFFHSIPESLEPNAATEPSPTPTRNSRDRRFLQIWRTELRNSSYLKSEFLSTITLRCKLEQASEFAWNNLHTAPYVQHLIDSEERYTPDWAQVIAGKTKLPASEYMPVVVIESVGLGPAVNVKCSITADSGLVIIKRDFPVLHSTAERITFCDYSIGGAMEVANRRVPLVIETRTEEVDEIRNDLAERVSREYTVQLPVMHSGSPRFAPPLYYRLEESTVLPAMFITHERVNYEVIETVSRLREITSVAWRESAKFEMTYESLTSQHYSKAITLDLPQWIVYYQPLERLLWYKPKEGKPRIYEEGGAAEAYTDEPKVKSTPRIEAIGEQLIKVVFTMDMWKYAEGEQQQQVAVVERVLKSVGEGEQQQQASVVDRFLIKSQGRLIVDLNLVHPRSGRYSVTVFVNDKMCEKYYVDVMAPERFRFDEDPEEIKRLQTALNR